MIELGLFLYKSVQDCGGLWSPLGRVFLRYRFFTLKDWMHLYLVEAHDKFPWYLVMLQFCNF